MVQIKKDGIINSLEYISKNELTDWLDVSISTINRKLPELSAIKLGKAREYISKNELANWLGVSLSTINRKLPELPAIKLGSARKSRVIFSVPKINEYLENLTPIKKRRNK